MVSSAHSASSSSSAPPRRLSRRPRRYLRHLTSPSIAIQLLVLILTLITHLAAAQDPTPTSASASSVAGGGSLNGPISTTAAASNNTGSQASTTTPHATASTSIPTLALSNSAVPYLLERPADAHVRHATKPRVKSQFQGCSDTGLDHAASAQRLNVSAVYAQMDTSQAPGVIGGQPYTSGVLRITGVGAIEQEAYGAANETFAAIQVQSRFLTFDIFSNLTFLCDNIAPTANDNETQLTAHSSCTYGPGQVAFGVDIPLNASYNLGTIWTRVLLIDTSHPPLSIACVDVPFSPYHRDEWYWSLMLWLPIALFLAYFVIVSSARAITAATTRSRAFRNRAREGSAPSFLRDHLNPVIISAISGQGMVLSPALLRFATPGCWDILFQLQFIGLLAMCAVNWPDFAYPFFKQAAWASLVGNVTLVQSDQQNALHSDPTVSNATLPVGVVGDQMANVSSPIYMNNSAPANFLDLKDAYTGIPAFAEMIGVHKADLFGTAMAIWLLIVAVFVAVAVIGWLIDTMALATTKIRQHREDSGLIEYQRPSEEPKGVDTFGSAVTGRRSNGGDFSHMDGDEYVAGADGNIRDSRHGYYGFLGSWPKGFNPNPHFHMAALHGNIVRAVTMFHLPLTVFTVYHISHADDFSTRSVALAGLSFAIVCVLLPVYLIWRIARAPVKKLYDDIETLLALGPVYNTYSPGSQLFYCVTFSHSLIAGIVVGAAQVSGSAQSIIILVIEVLLALASSLWLPWGEGAMMGPVSFLTSVLRVISAVLLVLLSAVVDFSSQATQWITYVILLLQGIFFAGAALILAFKLVESMIRLAFGVPYDERVNARSGGIGGAIRRIRRRRDKILQLSKGPKRSKGHLRSRSNGSAQSLVLATAPPAMSAQRPTRPTSFSSLSGSMMKGGPGSPPGGTSIPLSGSRQASYASYLDLANHQAKASSGGMSIEANKRQSPPTADLLSGPYAAYFQQDGDEEDANIMAALPPTSPGPWGPSPLPTTPGSTGKMVSSSGVTTAAGTPTVGFERIRGGRATDTDPYASLGKSRNRDAFGRPTGGELSSTAAAAQFARAQSKRARNDGEGAGSRQAGRGAFGGVFRGFSRRSPGHGSVEEDYVTSEDEDDPWGGTWGTSTLSTQHGPWNGLVKMQAALSGLKGRLTGQPPANRGGSSSGEHTMGGISEEGDSVPPGGSGGFQVIRAPRRGGGGGGNGGGAGGAVSSPQQSHAQPSTVTRGDRTHADEQTEDMLDSTAIARRHAYGHRGASDSGSGSGTRVGGSEYTDPFGSAERSKQSHSQNNSSSRPDSQGSSAFMTPPPSRPLSSHGLSGMQESSRSTSDVAPPLLQLRHLGGSGDQTSQDDFGPLHLGSLSGNGNDGRNSSALGILGADLRRATSDARVDAQEEERRVAQENREERFWLPPGAGAGSGEREQQPNSSANAWRTAEGMTAKIELMDSDE